MAAALGIQGSFGNGVFKDKEKPSKSIYSAGCLMAVGKRKYVC